MDAALASSATMCRWQWRPENHLIVTHEVTTSGSDRSQLARVGKAAKAVMRADTLEAVADRGYFNSPEILACHEAGITVTLPKPMTSGTKSEGRFGKQDFVYVHDDDIYRCPAGERLTYRYTNEEDGKRLRRYWTTACTACPLKPKCTTGRSAGSRDGSMSIYLRQYSSGSTRTRKRCASGVKRSSIPSARSRPEWARRTS